ncbi:MAG: hypothetical protein ABIT04_01470 [Novosphingobium sp.]
MSLIQLTPPLPVEVTGKGNGLAFAVMENGPDQELVWVSAIDLTGEICHSTSAQVRMRLKEAAARGSASEDSPASATVGRASSRYFKDEGGDISWNQARAIDIPDADAEHSCFP